MFLRIVKRNIEIDNMPTPTFLKLKPEKRDKIIETALHTFATQDFEAVSITRFMQDLEMPKGSFYQYFEDKRDLYFYLFEHFQQKKDTALSIAVGAGKVGFWDIWESWLLAELTYHWQNPLEWSFWLNACKERNSPSLGNLQALIHGRVAQSFLSTLRQESRQGALREEAHLELQAYFLAQTSEAITQYILHKFSITLPTLPALPATEIKIIIQNWLALVKYGFLKTVE